MRKFKVGDFVRANTIGIIDHLGITKEEATYLLGGCHEVESVNPNWSVSIQSCDNFNTVYNIDDRFLEKVDLPKEGDSITVESLEWFMSTLNGNKDTVFAHNNKCSDEIDIYGFSIIALKTFIVKSIDIDELTIITTCYKRIPIDAISKVIQKKEPLDENVFVRVSSKESLKSDVDASDKVFYTGGYHNCYYIEADDSYNIQASSNILEELKHVKRENLKILKKPKVGDRIKVESEVWLKFAFRGFADVEFYYTNFCSDLFLYTSIVDIADRSFVVKSIDDNTNQINTVGGFSFPISVIHEIISSEDSEKEDINDSGNTLGIIETKSATKVRLTKLEEAVESMKAEEYAKKDGCSNNANDKINIPEVREKPKNNIFEAMLMMTKQ